MKIATAKEVGLFIRSRREELGWTQGRLCALAGTRQPWLSEVEQGTTNPELGKVLAILRALDVTIELSTNRRSESAVDRPPGSMSRIQTRNENKTGEPVGMDPAAKAAVRRVSPRFGAAASTGDRVKVDLKAHLKRHLKIADGD